MANKNWDEGRGWWLKQDQYAYKTRLCTVNFYGARMASRIGTCGEVVPEPRQAGKSESQENL